MSIPAWVRPYKGPPNHLTRKQFLFRCWLYRPIWLVFAIPFYLSLVAPLLGGPFAFYVIFASPYHLWSDWSQLSDEVKFVTVAPFLFWATLGPIVYWMKHRLCTPQGSGWPAGEWW